MDVKSWKPVFQKLFSRDKGVKFLVVLGLSGIVLIYLSSLLGASAKKDTVEPKEEANSAVQMDYEEKLEKSLAEIVCAITGEEAPTVMVTLKKGEESVYAADEKNKSDVSGGTQEQEKAYVILKNSDGSQYALSVTEIQPEVKGVVIVSKSAEDPVIRERLVNAARTALGVSSSRVCVTCGR